jgi:hypothetical protein
VSDRGGYCLARPRSRLICVQMVKADEPYIAGVACSQVRVKVGTRVAGKNRFAGIESLDREQVAGTAQAVNVALLHDAVLFRLAEREDLAGFPRLSGCQDRDVDLDLLPVGRIGDYPGTDLGWQTSEYLRIGPDREVAADGFEVRPGHLRQEAGP